MWEKWDSNEAWIWTSNMSWITRGIYKENFEGGIKRTEEGLSQYLLPHVWCIHSFSRNVSFTGLLYKAIIHVNIIQVLQTCFYGHYNQQTADCRLSDHVNYWSLYRLDIHVHCRRATIEKYVKHRLNCICTCNLLKSQIVTLIPP